MSASTTHTVLGTPSTVLASVITGECRNFDFRPSFGLTTPPTAETMEPSINLNQLPTFASLSIHDTG